MSVEEKEEKPEEEREEPIEEEPLEEEEKPEPVRDTCHPEHVEESPAKKKPWWKFW